jgi:hypothetical protein
VALNIPLTSQNVSFIIYFKKGLPLKSFLFMKLNVIIFYAYSINEETVPSVSIQITFLTKERQSFLVIAPSKNVLILWAFFSM